MSLICDLPDEEWGSKQVLQWLDKVVNEDEVLQRYFPKIQQSFKKSKIAGPHVLRTLRQSDMSSITGDTSGHASSRLWNHIQ